MAAFTEQSLRDRGYVRGPDGGFVKASAMPPNKPHDTIAPTRVSTAQPAQPTPTLARDGEREAPGAGCPLVRFTLRKIRPFDVDAKYTAIKDLLDGLQYAGLIRGDKEGEISLEVVQEKVRHRAEEETLIEIEYPEANTEP